MHEIILHSESCVYRLGLMRSLGFGWLCILVKSDCNGVSHGAYTLSVSAVSASLSNFRVPYSIAALIFIFTFVVAQGHCIASPLFSTSFMYYIE